MVLVKHLAVAAALATLATCAIGHQTHARGRHHHHHHVAHKRHHHHAEDANGNPAFALVHTALGLTSKVAASARERFQAFIDRIEIDHEEPETGELTPGFRIHDLGCLAHSGHMPGSKHYRGLACDFDQEKRSVTSEKFYHVTEDAHAVGLTDGCEWSRNPHERFTGPDCGHIEVPGPMTTISARHHHHKHRRHRRYVRN